MVSENIVHVVDYPQSGSTMNGAVELMLIFG
jgi:hypothetical protein